MYIRWYVHVKRSARWKSVGSDIKGFPRPHRMTDDGQDFGRAIEKPLVGSRSVSYIVDITGYPRNYPTPSCSRRGRSPLATWERQLWTRFRIIYYIKRKRAIVV